VADSRLHFGRVIGGGGKCPLCPSLGSTTDYYNTFSETN